jgi:hypothetical protein
MSNLCDGGWTIGEEGTGILYVVNDKYQSAGSLDIHYSEQLHLGELAARALGLDRKISALVAADTVQCRLAKPYLNGPELVGSDLSESFLHR